MPERRGLPRGDKEGPAELYRSQEAPTRLLLKPDEVTWMTKADTPDRRVDVFLLLGCGVRGLPHIMVDSVRVLEALGVSFVAGAGQQYCCGNPYRPDRLDAADRLTAASMDRMTAWGVREIAHWCTACELTFGAWSRDSTEVWSGGQTMPMEPRGAPQDHIKNVHIHDLIERRLRELGDRVPWKNVQKRRVLVEGHPELTEVHDVAMTTGARMLSLVPGVEVLGYVEAPRRFKRGAKGNCNSLLQDMSVHDVQRVRAEIAAQAKARGADTISCQHHNCHRTWSRIASPAVRVQQCVSIVAEALGVVSEDRFQQFANIGDLDAIMSASEPIWRSWDMTAGEAREIVTENFDPKFSVRPTCACGGDLSKCGEAEVMQISDLVRGADYSLVGPSTAGILRP